MSGAAEAGVLLAVGVVAGVISVVVSLASLVSYPALLALGLPPVAANVTNTVSLTFTGIGSTLGSRAELAGHGRTVLRLAVVSTLGGATGATLLLALPGATFERVVPLLVAGAATLLLVQPRLVTRGFHPRGLTPATVAALFCAAVYTGYFGAAGGVVTLVVLGTILDRSLVVLNAVKNALAGFANGVAALGFALAGPVDWAAVVPLAAGFLVGGRLGPSVARVLPDGVLRGLVAGCGLAVAAVLAWRTYR